MKNFTLGILILVCLVLARSQMSSVDTLVTQTSPYFESGVVDLVQTSSIRFSCKITFQTVKSTTYRTILSFHSLDYDLNTIYTANQSLLLNITLYTSLSSTSGFTALAETISASQLRTIKYSYFVLDSLFPYYSSFSFVLVSFPNKNYYFNFNHPAVSPKFAVFLRGFNYEVIPETSTST